VCFWCVAVCCSVLQCVLNELVPSVLQCLEVCGAVCCSVFLVCCSVFLVCCSVLQCVAVCFR